MLDFSPMQFERVAEAVAGVPNMTLAQGRSVYDHLTATHSQHVLELGTAHGVSACYMAAAVEERGGRVVTIDQVTATESRQPPPSDVIKGAGLHGAIERVLVADSSYTWWLKKQIDVHSDASGNVEPQYDFCYIDGAHNWTIDGLSVYLVEKLLRPGGWLLLDDLEWLYDPDTPFVGPGGQGADDLGLSQDERAFPHMRAVFDLIVKPHPSFTEFRVQNDSWGWAGKNAGAQRKLEIVEVAPPVATQAKRLLRKLRHSERLRGVGTG